MVATMEIQEGFKQTEVGVIPSDWKVPIIDEISEVKSGKRLPLGKSLTDRETSHPYIRVVDMFMGGVSLNDIKYVPDDVYPSIKHYCIFIDDIFISVAGSLGIVGKIPYKLDGANLTENADRLTNISCNRDYLLYVLMSWLIQNKIEAEKTLGAQPKLALTRIRKFFIPLPPTKTEQTAIATALNDTDALITKLEKFIAKKRAIKQGAMQKLLKPKEGWGVKNLGKIADIRRGASPRPIKNPKWFSDSGRGWIRISDVTSSNVYLNSTTQYLSEDGARNSVAVNRGDLIMSICATIGIPIIINIPACIHDGFVLFKNYEKELDTFFLYFSLQVKTEILTGKGQPGTQKNLNTTIVGDIEIDYPDVDEQRKIGLILRDIDIEISGLEMKLDKLKMLKQGMMQNLLTGRIRLV